MEKRKSKNRGIDEIIDTIIELPEKNLEKRINEIESEISVRRSILNEALLNLGTQKLQLEGKIWQLRYSSLLGFTFSVKVGLEKELARTEIRKTDEWISYFRDVSRLKEKLQDAREELALEKEKRRLVET